jgi:predicted phosphoribosyltransferase
VTEAGELHLNQPLIGQVRLTPQEIYQIAKKEQTILQQELIGWGVTAPSSLVSKTVVIVDDGMHSGWTMYMPWRPPRNWEPQEPLQRFQSAISGPTVCWSPL